eukprot:5630852-Amphidinium_carterae.1
MMLSTAKTPVTTNTPNISSSSKPRSRTPKYNNEQMNHVYKLAVHVHVPLWSMNRTVQFGCEVKHLEYP